jgi:hypothetical protein
MERVELAVLPLLGDLITLAFRRALFFLMGIE